MDGEEFSLCDPKDLLTNGPGSLNSGVLGKKKSRDFGKKPSRVELQLHCHLVAKKPGNWRKMP